jgi:hypothetical protein
VNVLTSVFEASEVFFFSSRIFSYSARVCSNNEGQEMLGMQELNEVTWRFNEALPFSLLPVVACLPVSSYLPQNLASSPSPAQCHSFS